MKYRNATNFWQTKTFKTKEQYNNFVTRYGDSLRWQEIFVNNAYGIQFIKLREM
jgi:hypothetical protein